MTRRGLSLEFMADLLAFYDKLNGKIPDIDKCFMELFINPNLDTPNVNKDDIEYALTWCRRPDRTGQIKQDNLYWNLNFRELGIVNSGGTVNQVVAEQASHFIWGDRNLEPDYYALKSHLAKYLPQTNLVSSETKAPPKSYQDKLKKQNRNRGKNKKYRRS